jgi:hypothetical protein
MDHGHERLGQGGEGFLPARGDAAVRLLVGHVAPSVLELGDIGTGHEGLLAGPAEDDHSGISCHISWLTALRFSGWLKMIQPIGPSFSINSFGVPLIVGLPGGAT